MVRQRFAGRSPSPVIRVRDFQRERTSAPRVVSVLRVVQETHETVTLVLGDPNGAPFVFAPGQFFTVLTDIGGETTHRNYSGSNRPGGPELCLTIKKKEGGKVSGLLARSKPGDQLQLLGPFGSFCVRPEPGSSRRIVLVAGGVGITPLLSIAQTILAAEPESEIALLYGNRRREDVVFASELAALEREHAGRFVVRHALESPPPDWDGAVGRLDRVLTTALLEKLPLAGSPDVEFFICGPDPMREEVMASLAARGVPSTRIHLERFVIGLRHTLPADSATGNARRVTIVSAGKTLTTTALAGATLLEAGLAAGIPMPFSCGVGGCGACRVRLVEGEVDVEDLSCLTDAERAEGFVLTCVGRPRGPCTIEVNGGSTGNGGR